MDHISRPVASSQRTRLTLREEVLRPMPLAALAGFLLIVLFCLWVGRVVRTSAHEITAAEMKVIRDSNVAALRLWLDQQATTTAQLARSASESAATNTWLARHSSGSVESLKNLPSDPTHTQWIATRIPASDQHAGWTILNLDGWVLAASDMDWVGHSLPISEHAWRSVAAGEATVSHPFSIPLPLRVRQQTIPAGTVMMTAVAPIRSEGPILGYLAILLDPAKEFAELLKIARAGTSGETYVFDKQGRMLSASRFPEQLRAVGLLPRETTVTSPLNLEIRDPHVNLIRGYTTDVPRAEQPLTRMAEDATRGGTGDDGVGYNDYRGVPVVGAWTWLEAYQLGVATEMNVDEAHQPLFQLQLAFWSMVSLLTAVGLGFVGMTMLNQHLRLKAATVDQSMRQLGNYQLGEEIGSGGMGKVYRGYHQLLRRPVAVKVLEANGADPRAIERFEREVQRTSELQHPNTIQIYDYGHTGDSTFFYVMELVDGLDLAQLTETYGPQPPARVVHILTQICGSLAEAHGHGLVHRDIKPANLLLSSPAGVCDYIKVVDFGLVKDISGVDSSAVTKVESLTGTPLYMSPEAIRDASAVDARADIYSLGAVGYYLLSGRHLFDGNVPVDICMLQVGQMPPRPCDRIDSQRLGKEMPEDLQDLLMDCLQKSADRRPQSITQVAERLRRCKCNGQWTIDDAEQWWAEEYDKQQVDRHPIAALFQDSQVEQSQFRQGHRTLAE